jgi:predicted Zn-dependent protease
LAVIDNAEKRPDEARARLEAAIKQQPANIQAYQLLLELRAAHGADKAELTGILRRAVDGAPNNPVPRQMLAEHYLRTGEPKEALTVAQNAAAALPDNMQLLDVLGAPSSPMASTTRPSPASTAWRRCSQVTAAVSAHVQCSPGGWRPAAAAEKLRKALEITPTYCEAQQGLASLAMAANKPDEALAIARTVQKQRPKEAAGYILEGEIQAAGKAWTRPSTPIVRA